jgi:hypothetical protein
MRDLLLMQYRAQPTWVESGFSGYRGTSIMRIRTALGPYRRPMPSILRGSWGDGCFLMGGVPLHCPSSALHRSCPLQKPKGHLVALVAVSVFSEFPS